MQNQIKLLAIRPLYGCAGRFLKNLNKGQVYKFYNNYKYYEKEEGQEIPDLENRLDINFVESNPHTSENLFNIKTADNLELAINISAIVGKNGSGKSSLIELLFAAIYKISVDGEMLEPNLKTLENQINAYDEDFQNFTDTKINFIEKKKEILDEAQNKSNIKPISNEIEFIDKEFRDLILKENKQIEIDEWFSKEKERLQKENSDILQFGKDLKVEIFYQISNTIFKLTTDINVNDSKTTTGITIVKSNLEESNDELRTLFRDYKIDQILSNPLKVIEILFYTIAINYSSHSLNANILGNWINRLFHKNDGYKTPIVINPMRIDGIYDVNKELKFAKYRLLSNVMIEKKNKNVSEEIYITDRHYISKVIFKLNKHKLAQRAIDKNDLKKIQRADKLLRDVIVHHLPDFEFKIKDINPLIINYVRDYIFHKINRIKKNYDGYKTNSQFDNYEVGDELILKLLNEKSHVAFKLKQALNFLKNSSLEKKSSEFAIVEEGENIFYFTLNSLLDWMGSPEPEEIIEYLPISLFDIEFKLIDRQKGNEESSFGGLSSGEQQLIHSVQSVVYHLNNLQSVHSDEERYRFAGINIIFDEIELYFHPDYQRKFIQHLRDSLKKLYLNRYKPNGINSINILFLTHSPFILSDIPNNNILKIKEGNTVREMVKSETFAANIHEILSTSFFFENQTYKGEFAHNFILEKIDEVKKYTENSETDIETLQKEINIIGEPFLKVKLLEMLDRNKNRIGND